MTRGGFVLFLISALLSGAPQSAFADCPGDAEEIGRVTEGEQVRIRCRCTGEKLHVAGQCVAPEEAPLSNKALAVVTGAAFSAADALRAFARKQPWSLQAVEAWELSTFEAQLGRYERARSLLGFAQDLTGPDKVGKTFDGSLSALENLRQSELERLFDKYPPDLISMFILETADCDPDCVLNDKAFLFNRALSEAALDREFGDHEAAIEKYRDARRVADLSGLAPRYRRLANNGIVWSRQLRASVLEHEDAEAAGANAALNKKRRTEIIATRAEMLASHLAAAGQGDKAIAYLSEAESRLQQTDPGRAALVAERIARLEADGKAGLSLKDGRPLSIYTNASSQPNIMLDAIEYGAGDWSRSIRFLEAAHEADPKNTKIFGALNYVKGLSAAQP